MPCKICKLVVHNKRTCPLLITCSTCGQRGHPKTKCTFKCVYDCIPILPKDIIKIIHAFKGESELYDYYKSYFTRIIIPELHDYKVVLVLKKVTNPNYINNTTFKKLIFPEIQKLMRILMLTLSVQDKRNYVLMLYNYINEFSWLFDRLNHEPCVQRIINKINKKVIQYENNGIHNLSFYNVLE